jgi:hypothetical protein
VDKHDLNDLYRLVQATDEWLKQIEEHLKERVESLERRVMPDPAWQAFLDDHPELTT